VRSLDRDVLEDDVYQMFLPTLPTEQARSAMRDWIRLATTDTLSRIRRGKGIAGKGVSFDADGETFTITKDLAYDPKFYVASKNLAHLISELTERGGRKVANLAKLVLPTLRILADEVLPPKGIKPTKKQVEGHYFFAKRVLEQAREIIKRYYEQTGLDEAITAYAKRTGRKKATPEVIDEIRAAMKAGREADLLGQPIEMFLLADAPPLPPPPARKAGSPPPGLEKVKPTGRPPTLEGKGGGQKAGFIRRMMGEIKLKHGGEPYGDEDADASYRHPTRPLSRDTRMDAPVAFDYFKMPKESRMMSKHIMKHLFRVRPYSAAERAKLNEYEKGMLAEAGVRGGKRKLRGGMEMGVYPAPPLPPQHAEIIGKLEALRPEIESNISDEALGEIFQKMFNNDELGTIRAFLDAIATAHEEDGDDDFDWRQNLDELLEDLLNDEDDDPDNATIVGEEGEEDRKEEMD
jgi:hypothetical protein